MKKSGNLILACIGLLGILSCNRQPDDIETDLAIPVSVMDIKTGDIETYVNTTGTVLATHETELMSEITGRYRIATNPFTGRPYKLGDRVKQGQVIIYLEDKEYENGIAIEAKKLNFDISEMEFRKQESLYEKGGVTLREFRNSEVAYINAKYDYESAQIRLEKMKVVAPFGGAIVDLPYHTPETRVNTGQSMVKLMAYSNMYMEINLPEKHLQDLKTGQNVYITSYVFPEDTLSGRISEISPAISTETRTFKCKLLVQNPKLKLRPGMFVKADIVIQRKSDIITIPKEYILSDARGKRVFIVQQSTARMRRITTGLENQYEVEIISGLETNQRLVIKGFETLRDRAKIKIIQ